MAKRKTKRQPVAAESPGIDDISDQESTDNDVQPESPPENEPTIDESADPGADQDGQSEAAADPAESTVATVATEALYCRKHFVRMRVYASGEGGRRDGETQYLRCPVKGCDTRGTVLAAHRVIPSEPLVCPIHNRPCEYVPAKSSSIFATLQCPEPGCRFRDDVLRPEFDARRKRAERDLLDI